VDVKFFRERVVSKGETARSKRPRPDPFPGVRGGKASRIPSRRRRKKKYWGERRTLWGPARGRNEGSGKTKRGGQTRRNPQVSAWVPLGSSRNCLHFRVTTWGRHLRFLSTVQATQGYPLKLHHINPEDSRSKLVYRRKEKERPAERTSVGERRGAQDEGDGPEPDPGRTNCKKRREPELALLQGAQPQGPAAVEK